MEKHVGLNPAWFEPGPDGVSPFERISATVGFGAAGTATAFRALIAQDAAQEPEPPALQVGDVVRLERYEDGMDGWAFLTSESHLVGTEHTISKIDEDGVSIVANTTWPVSALTLIRRAGEVAHDERDALINQQRGEIERLTAELEKAKEWPAQALQMRYNRDMYLAVLKLICETYPETEDGELCDAWRRLLSERDAARAEVERLSVEPIESARVITIRNQRNELAALNKAYGRVTAERDALRAKCNELEMEKSMGWHEYDELKSRYDALQARIDAGVRIVEYAPNGISLPWWSIGLVKTGKKQRTGILLIDAQPIAPAYLDMVAQRDYWRTIVQGGVGDLPLENNAQAQGDEG